MPSIEGGGVEKNLFIVANYLTRKINHGELSQFQQGRVLLLLFFSSFSVILEAGDNNIAPKLLSREMSQTTYLYLGVFAIALIHQSVNTDRFHITLELFFMPTILISVNFMCLSSTFSGTGRKMTKIPYIQTQHLIVILLQWTLSSGRSQSGQEHSGIA